MCITSRNISLFWGKRPTMYCSNARGNSNLNHLSLSTFAASCSALSEHEKQITDCIIANIVSPHSARNDKSQFHGHHHVATPPPSRFVKIASLTDIVGRLHRHRLDHSVEDCRRGAIAFTRQNKEVIGLNLMAG
jgi:hypothetical protein